MPLPLIYILMISPLSGLPLAIARLCGYVYWYMVVLVHALTSDGKLLKVYLYSSHILHIWLLEQDDDIC